MPIVVVKPYCGPNSGTINPFIKEYIRSVMACTKQYNRLFRKEFGYSHYNLFSRERTIYSLMSAAMHRLTPVHESEIPITRRRDMRLAINQDREPETSGRVDLWSCKDGIEYFFEFKRSYVSLFDVVNNQRVPRIHRQWSRLVQQVGEVRRGQPNEGACYIGLQIITPFLSSQDKDIILSPPMVTRRHIENWMPRLGRHLHAVLYHSNPRNMRVTPTKWNRNEEVRWEFHPCHLFCFTIYSPQN